MTEGMRLWMQINYTVYFLRTVGLKLIHGAGRGPLVYEDLREELLLLSI